MQPTGTPAPAPAAPQPAPGAGGPGGTGRGRQPARTPRSKGRPGRGQLVAAETGLGSVLGGVVVGGPLGWAAAGCGGAVLVGVLARGRWPVAARRWPVAARRWPVAAGRGPRSAHPAGRPGSAHPAGRAASDPAGGRGSVGLGVAAVVAPRLEVDEFADRNGQPFGIAWDGQGFVAAVELDTSGPLRLAVAALAEQVAGDAAEPAGVQVLVEQIRLPLPGVWPATPDYQQVARGELTLTRRVFLVLRYEPIWTPAAIGRRGAGGADGARRALAAALARLRVWLTGRGTTGLPLTAAGLGDALRTVGDPSADAELAPDAVQTAARTHRCVAATIRSATDWATLLRAAAAGPGDRSVLSLAVDLDQGTTLTRAAARLVATDPTRAAAAGAALQATGLARPLHGNQVAGMLATLPLGGGPRPLRTAIGLAAR